MKKKTSAHNTDPRESPVYSMAEAARYLRLAPATLRSWILGRPYPKHAGAGFSHPLISIVDRKDQLLSFTNLVEAHVLAALRADHGLP